MKHETEHCVGCDAVVPIIEGPVHRYMTSTPACWSAFGKLTAALAARSLFEARQCAVDAFAVQHPGVPEPQSIQSVAVHLISLYAYLEMGQSVTNAPAILKHAAAQKGVYRWLTPPSFREARTVHDVRRAAKAETLAADVRAWTESAWTAWKAHHAQVAEWHARLAES